MADNTIGILFLGGAKRVSMARHFKAAALARGLRPRIYSYEMTADVPIAIEGEVIIGKRWRDEDVVADIIGVCRDRGISVVIPFVDGAVAVAAAMFDKLDLAGKKTVCLLSGGNIDVTILSRVIARGLLMSGRSCQLLIELVDKPGQLLTVSRVIAEQGGNVTAVHHEHTNEGSDVNGCYLRLSLETRNAEHIQQIKQALTDAGIKII